MQQTPELAEIIGQRMRVLRESDTSTQRELADLTKVPLAVLNRAIRGTATPSPDALVKIANHYGVSTDWILGLTDKRPRRKRQPTK